MSSAAPAGPARSGPTHRGDAPSLSLSHYHEWRGPGGWRTEFRVEFAEKCNDRAAGYCFAGNEHHREHYRRAACGTIANPRSGNSSGANFPGCAGGKGLNETGDSSLRLTVFFSLRLCVKLLSWFAPSRKVLKGVRRKGTAFALFVLTI